MSSRALRKLQREQEQQRQLAELHREDAAGTEEEDESDDDRNKVRSVQTKRQTPNAFAFLNADTGGDRGNEDDADGEGDQLVGGEAANEMGSPKETSDSNDDQEAPAKSLAKKKGKGKKKKKKKAAKTENAGYNTEVSKIENDGKLDEIDLALKSLQVQDNGKDSSKEAITITDGLQRFYENLAIDSRNLNALNEMKKLFGHTVLEGEADGEGGPARRRGRGPQQLDLGRALAGRYNPVSRGQGLAGLALRKNIFMLGREEWPKATSGGLGMEVVEKAWDFTTEYRFVHNSAYQDVQRQFESCVESGDPQRMIHLLQYNPYHISTLLQVSEIAKQQGDHAVSADLLERALFTFGRSVHSSFHTALAEGKARLDFRRPENREFWLASWRYLGALGQRGTWRTAYEWAKLVLSLDPEEDPYQIRLIIDQLAIRGGQFEHFLKLAATDPAIVDWGQKSANVEISSSLAHYKLKHTVECRAVLDLAVRRYPWIFAQLLRELNIDHIPKSVWGKSARNEQEELEAAAYVTRAKDIWNTPEALSLLVEVVETADGPSLTSLPHEGNINRNVARHILLSDIPALIGFLPRNYTSERTSASDPLPPEFNLASYSTDPATQIGMDFSDDYDEEDEEDEMPDRNSRGTAGEAAEAVAQGNSYGGFPTMMQFLQSITQRAIDAVASNTVAEGNDGEDARNDSDELESRSSRFTLEEIRRQLTNADGTQLDLAQLEGRLYEQSVEALSISRLREQQERRREQEQQDQRATSGGDDHALSTQSSSPLPTEQNLPSSSSSLSAPAHPSSSSSAPISPLPPPDLQDDEANSRWLAGRGLQWLKEVINKSEQEQDNSTTTTTFTTPVAGGRGEDQAQPEGENLLNPSQMRKGVLQMYVERLSGLRDRAKRNFILEYAIPQGASAAVAAEVKRALVEGA